MSIHTIGDSHANGSWMDIPRVIRHHLGAVLCHSFGRDKLKRCDIRDFNLHDGDTLIFCFGEIDGRCHIHKYTNDVMKYQDVIDNIVNNYFDAIQLNVITSQVKFKNVCVYNVVPTIQKENKYHDPGYPHLGSDEERKAYVLYFNQKIKEKCNEYNYIFFDIYDKYIDENGYLKEDLSDGHVHIRDPKYIIDFIRDNDI